MSPFAHLYRDDLPKRVVVAGGGRPYEILRQAIAASGVGGRPEDWEQQFGRYRRIHPTREAGFWEDDPQIASLVEAYEETLHRVGLVDFDDIVSIALGLVREQSLVRASLEARFPYLVVDEYQDLGLALHLIVKTLMAETGIEVFAVGDPDQSIYGFAGADPGYLIELASDSHVHVVRLVMNYRSAQGIIDGSQIALAAQSPRDYRSARATPEGTIDFVECPNGLEEQAETICAEILPRLNASGVESGEIAILYIDRRDAEVLSKALDEHGIRYAGERDQRYSRTPFTRWLEDAALWCSRFPDASPGSSLEELAKNWAMLVDAGASWEAANGLSERTRFFSALREVADGGLPLFVWLTRLGEVLEIEKHLSDPTNLQALEDWTLLRNRAEPGKPLGNLTVEDFAGGRGRGDTVTLSTLHSSKGLEYRAVIIPGLEEGRLPGYAATTVGALAEARRLFYVGLYVGLTRAKDVVYLLYSGRYTWNGHIFGPGPSRFVVELRARLSSAEKSQQK